MSLDKCDTSMGKIAGKRGGEIGREGHLLLKAEIEFSKLSVGKGEQEAFEEDDGLSKTGIEVVVRGFESFPILIFLHGKAFV